MIINKVQIEYTIGLLFITAINFPSEIIRYLRLVREKINYFYHPSLITDEAEKLIEGAKRLGLISDSEIFTIIQMITDKKSEVIDTIMIVDKS